MHELYEVGLIYLSELGDTHTFIESTRSKSKTDALIIVEGLFKSKHPKGRIVLFHVEQVNPYFHFIHIHYRDEYQEMKIWTRFIPEVSERKAMIYALRVFWSNFDSKKISLENIEVYPYLS